MASSYNPALGNPFDQSLNTADSPTFADITASGKFHGDGSLLSGISGGGSPPFSIVESSQLAYCPNNEASGFRQGIGFDENGWPYLTPSGLEQFGFDGDGSPIIQNRYSHTVIGIDVGGHPFMTSSGVQKFAFDTSINPVIINGNSDTVFGIDSHGQPYLTPSGPQMFGFNDAGEPIIVGVNGNTIFTVDGFGQPSLLNNAANTGVGFDSDGNPLLYSHSGESQFGFDDVGNPVITSRQNYYPIFGMDGNGYPYMVSSGTSGFSFDSGGNPVITADNSIVIINNLGTSGSGVSNQLWKFTGDVTALVSYLAGGGSLVAMVT